MSETCHICFPGTIQKWSLALHRYPFPDKGYLIIVNIEFSNFETFYYYNGGYYRFLQTSYQKGLKNVCFGSRGGRGGERSKLLKCHFFCSFCIENPRERRGARLPIETAAGKNVSPQLSFHFPRSCGLRRKARWEPIVAQLGNSFLILQSASEGGVGCLLKCLKNNLSAANRSHSPSSRRSGDL